MSKKLSKTQHEILSRLYEGEKLIRSMRLNSSSSHWRGGKKVRFNSIEALRHRGYVIRGEGDWRSYPHLITEKGREKIEEVGLFVPVVKTRKRISFYAFEMYSTEWNLIEIVCEVYPKTLRVISGQEAVYRDQLPRANNYPKSRQEAIDRRRGVLQEDVREAADNLQRFEEAFPLNDP